MIQERSLCLLLGALLLMALGGTVATAQAEAPERVASCTSCQQLEESCMRNCSMLETRGAAAACRMACTSVADSCSWDEPITLSSEDVVAMGLAEGPSALASACNSTTPCPPEYGSCAGWSAYSNCGDGICGTFKFCGDPPWCYEPDLCFGPALYQERERFRVCFNSTGQSCTEYQRLVPSVPTSCGC